MASFYLRKSLRAGPFRLNLSRSGIGLSVGVPGFRVGAGLEVTTSIWAATAGTTGRRRPPCRGMVERPAWRHHQRIPRFLRAKLPQEG
jgi:hypothetical protein